LQFKCGSSDCWGFLYKGWKEKKKKNKSKPRLRGIFFFYFLYVWTVWSFLWWLFHFVGWVVIAFVVFGLGLIVWHGCFWAPIWCRSWSYCFIFLCYACSFFMFLQVIVVFCCFRLLGLIATVMPLIPFVVTLLDGFRLSC